MLRNDRQQKHFLFCVGNAGVAQLVEHHLAKVRVAGSSLVSRLYGGIAKWLRQRIANP